MPWETQDVMTKRIEFAMKALQTENFRALCREYGISPKVGYKWKERFLQQGLEGMQEQSRRPTSSPAALSEQEICRIVRLKERHRHWGPRKLQELYRRQWGSAPSESSFKRVLERCGLTEKRRVRTVKETGRIASGRKAAAPNEVWTVDFKGWWYDAQGRCNPLTVRDEYSRMVLELRAVADANTQTVQSCFERLFNEYGVPGAIRSDNGPPFASHRGLMGLSRLSAWWLANGIELERSRPGCPQDNGAHERMHRGIAGELEGTPYDERQAALDTWREEFNTQRPHEALGMRCPAEVYTRGARWAGTPDQLRYSQAQTRRVLQYGHIRFEGEPIFLSQALSGWDVGLQVGQDSNLDVYFGRLLLGRLEPETAAFVPITEIADAQIETPNPEKTP
jgi:transposase InsO family protein